jgi:uncharacterized protein DUF397
MTQRPEVPGMDGPDLSGAAWQRSSRSSGNGQCVEWAYLDDAVAVRNSREPEGPVLVFTLEEWRAFVEATHRPEHI